MAVVGEAQIIVRAIGTRVKSDITDIFKGLDSVGGESGKSLGEKFSQGFNKSGANNSVGKLADGLKKMYPEAERARETWQKLTKTGFVLGPMIAGLAGSISAFIGSLVSVAGAAGAAGASLIVFGNVLSAMGLAMLSAKIALGGVMEALGKMGKGGGGAAKATDAIRRAQERLALVIEQNNEAIINANNRITDAQLNLNDALAAGREELQQLGFAAEEAALAEQGAALDLERAREELARVQDLPPNSRIRREAELAFAQAELQYRQAVDTNADLAAEQEKYSQTGVEGTQDVINARRELADAEADLARTVRDGLRAQIEAERALAEARKGVGGGGADPFEGLTKSQKIFVKEMYKLKPLFDDVKEQVAAAFLPLFGDAIKTFANKVLPTIGGGLAKIGGALGKAAVRFADFLASAEGTELITTFFDNAAKLIGPMADAFGLLLGIFIRLMNAAAPVAEKFVDWIVEGFENFNNYLKDLDKDGSLTKFFEDAGDAAAEFGDFFGEVFRLIGQIIGANLGEDSPGRDMVRWMTDGLRAANDLRDGVGGSGLKDYFEAVNKNVKPLLGFLGDMGRILIDMGANPAVGEMFTILRKAEPSIRKIGEALLGAAPALAELGVQILRIVAAFVDTEQIEAFLGTLSKIATVVADVVEQAWFQKLLEQIGPLLGTFLALQTAGNAVKFGFNVLIGSVIGVLGAVAGLVGPFNFLVNGFKNMPGPIQKILGPLGQFAGFGLKAVSWILAIVVAIVTFATKSEEFRKSLGGLVDTIFGLFAGVGQALSMLLAPAMGVFNALYALFEGLIGYSVAFLSTILQVIGIIVGFFWDRLYKPIAPVFEGIKAFWDDLAGKITGFFNGVIGGMNTFVGWVKRGFAIVGAALDFVGKLFGALFKIFWDKLYKPIEPAVTEIGNFFNDLGKILEDVFQWFSDVFSGVVDFIEKALGMAEAFFGIESAASGTEKSLDGVSESAGGASTNLGTTADAIDATGTSASNNTGAVNGFAEGIGKINTSAVDAITSNLDFKDSTAQLGETLKNNKKTLDDNTQAGRDNQRALIDAAKAVSDKMQADIDSGVPLAEARDAYRENYEALKQTAINAGLAADEVDAFVKSVLGANLENVIELKLKTDTAQKKLNDFIRKNGGTPAVIGGAGVTMRAMGGLNDYVKGTAFAGGGIAEGMYRSMARPLYKFAEPETGWEAFVSGRKGSEDRNRGIVREAASRLGMNMGGVSITVNPSAGMDERALAGAVSQEITKLMRKGSMY
jgi:hypothetical protein